MAALWACEPRRHAGAQIAATPASPSAAGQTRRCSISCCGSRRKHFVRTEKQGNKNLYTPLVRRLTYCGAVSQCRTCRRSTAATSAAMVRALADTGRHDLRRHRASAPLAGRVPGREPGVRLRVAPSPPFLSPLCGQLPPRGEPNQAASRTIACPRTAWARGSSAPLASRRSSIVSAWKNRFHSRLPVRARRSRRCRES